MIPPGQAVDRSTQEVSLALNKICHQILFVFFILSSILVGTNLVSPLRLPIQPSGLEAFLVFFATATTLFSLSRQLPAQNVLLAGAIIAVIGTAASLIGAKTSIPFGPFIYSEDFKPRVNGVPWVVPFIWVLAVLNSRGVARLILRPWRKTRNYGWWLIGLTVVLCILLDLGWEIFAAPVKHYVLWGETKFPVNWHGVPLINFLGWILTLLLILAFATPALINKRHTKSVPDYNPLVVWLLFNALFLTGAAVNQIWSAVIVTGTASALTAIFAMRGAHW